MYEFSFIYNAQNGNEIEVTVDMRASRDDYDIVDFKLQDLNTGKSLEMSDFSKKEQHAIDERINYHMHNHHAAAYQHLIETFEDEVFERWRDNV